MPRRQRRTTIAPQSRLVSYESVLRLLRYFGASEEEIAEMERDLHSWGHGDLWVDLIPDRKNLLRVHALWNEGLTPPDTLLPCAARYVRFLSTQTLYAHFHIPDPRPKEATDIAPNHRFCKQPQQFCIRMERVLRYS